MWSRVPTHNVNHARWRAAFFAGRGFCHRIAGNFAEWYFRERYSGASFVHVYRRCSRFRSLFKLNYDEVVLALDGVGVPNFAA
jgi:hypothetical protein